MERDVAAADNVTEGSLELVVSISSLDEAPAAFLSGARQDALDGAHEAGVAATRRSLERRLSIDFGAVAGAAGDDDAAARVPQLQVGRFAGRLPRDTVLPALLDAMNQWVGSQWVGDREPDDGGPALMLASGEMRRALTTELREPRALLSALAQGWTAVVASPRQLGSETEALLDDLAYAFDARSSRLLFGMHSARGPSEGPSDDPVLIVQLLGQRSVLIEGFGHPLHEQLPNTASTTMLIPANCVATHLPLDADTAHLEVPLPGLVRSTHSVDRARQAMRPVVASRSLDGARAAVDSIDDGWPMRLRAPGGAHLLADDEDGADAGMSTIAVGGMRLRVTARGVALVETLLGGEYLSAQALADDLGIEAEVVVAEFHRLWGEGLLDPAPIAAMPPVGNERLTQVATAELGPESPAPLLALLDAASWRPPTLGEVHAPAGLDVAVQPLDGAAAAAAIAHLVGELNERFLRVDVQLDSLERLLAVRVRPASSPSVTAVDAALTSLGSDLAHGHSTRKLTFALSLVDADGGWMTLPAGSDTADSRPGSLSVWPSFRPWTLQPITAGERLFLLGRAHGPAYV